MDGFKILEIYPLDYAIMRFALISIWPAAFSLYAQRRGYEMNLLMFFSYVAFLFPVGVMIRVFIFRPFFRLLALSWM